MIKGIMVNLQKEQVALMKKAIKLIPCHTEDDCTGQTTQPAQAEEVKKVNLQLQKLQMDLMQQDLSLKTHGEAATKYRWYRTHGDQEQQTELEDEAASEQEDKDIPMLEIQQLSKKNLDLEEAQLKVGHLEKDLLRIKEEAQEEIEKTQASISDQLEHLKNGNKEVSAAEKKSRGAAAGPSETV